MRDFVHVHSIAEVLLNNIPRLGEGSSSKSIHVWNTMHAGVHDTTKKADPPAYTRVCFVEQWCNLNRTIAR